MLNQFVTDEVLPSTAIEPAAFWSGLEDILNDLGRKNKVAAYRNWLGLMKGDLSASLQRGGKTVHRGLNPDRENSAPGGEPFRLPGRCLLFLRNVGHLMTSDAVIDSDGREIPEGIPNGMVTSLIAMHDLQGARLQDWKRLYSEAQDARSAGGGLHRSTV